MSHFGSVPTVTVITLTRDRVSELERAVKSVSEQLDVEVEHIVVADRCTALRGPSDVGELGETFSRVRLLVNDRRRATYLPTHLSELRYWAATVATGEFIALLDDDNVFEPEHCTSLIQELTRTGARVGYSWRSLWFDGKPWQVEAEDPWAPTPSLAQRNFALLEREGMLTSGSNIVRDMHLLPKSGRTGRVDTNEWLFGREVFLRYARPRPASAAERRLKLTEDVMITIDLVRDKVPIVRSERATVRYNMGGYSNRNEAKVDVEFH